ncbi:MAG: hypothetical protein QM733_24885 [Ilumatobacteraceae bacterium]
MDSKPNYLSTIRDLVIIIGIYLYFIAWVYVNAYYQHFGISGSSLKLDYASYLVFSFNVIMSLRFLWMLIIVIGILIILWFINYLAHRRGLIWLRKILKRLAGAKFLAIICSMAALFPWLFYITQRVAWSDYVDQRTNRGDLRSIQFVFRKDSDMHAPTLVLDSLSRSGKDLISDIRLLTADDTRSLKLLGQTDDQYIVLNQAPPDPTFGIPVGFVYFIDKKEVLLAKIILSSSQ